MFEYQIRIFVDPQNESFFLFMESFLACHLGVINGESDDAGGSYHKFIVVGHVAGGSNLFVSVSVEVHSEWSRLGCNGLVRREMFHFHICLK